MRWSKSERKIVGAALALSLAQGAQADPPPPQLLLAWSIDDEWSGSTLVDGTVTATGGLQYTLALTTPEGTCQITYSGSADFVPDPMANLAGNLTVKNLSGRPRDIRLALDQPLCPTIEGGSLAGLVVVMTLTTSGPGFASCISGGLFSATVDGAILKSLFTCPYTLQTTGSGTLTSTGTWGTPGASAVGAPSATSKGVVVRALLSDLDQLSFTFTYNTKSLAPQAATTCAGDLDDDGEVNAFDLALVIGGWGTGSAGACQSTGPLGDADGDGTVNAADLTIVLAAWGECPKE